MHRILLALTLLTAASFAQGEPTNAAEAAAQKAAKQAALDAKYEAWTATLTPEQQAWERISPKPARRLLSSAPQRGQSRGPIQRLGFRRRRSHAAEGVVDRGFRLPRLHQATRKALAGQSQRSPCPRQSRSYRQMA